MNSLLMIYQDYTLAILVVLLIILAVPVILTIIGFSCRKKNKKASKIFYILAVVYVVISLGICGSLML